MYAHLIKYHLLASACGLNTLNTLEVRAFWRIRCSRSLIVLGRSLSCSCPASLLSPLPPQLTETHTHQINKQENKQEQKQNKTKTKYKLYLFFPKLSLSLIVILGAKKIAKLGDL